MEASKIECVFRVMQELRAIQGHCVEALVSAEQTQSFTAEFRNGISLLNLSAERLRAQITEGPAFASGSDIRVKVEIPDSRLKMRLVNE